MMDAHTSTEATASAPIKLAYGGSFNKALCTRLERHFSDSTGDAEGQGKRALVIGLFGEWGCGKTLHLRHIQQHFQNRLDTSKHDSGLTLPVFFNAWRYEAEEHLIIPLLKTTEYQLQQWYDRQKTPAKKALKWISNRITQLGDSAVALGCGIKGTFELPGAKLEINPSAMLEEERKRIKQRADKQASYTDKLESLYYNFETEMRRLTGREGDGPKLNLLFLVDDLDRCLPEKAVKMLESIKLFLDVEGCAFVLALDDEVVERGIAHRYRDYGLTHNNRAMESIAHSLSPKRYREFDSGHDHVHANPITGHEYLEKIVQLPVRVPAPSVKQVETYLNEHFPSLFGDPGPRDGG